MQNTALAPRRRGRPCKSPVVNPRFPGSVIAITSVPRLRPGVVCEVVGCVQCHQNNGLRVMVEHIQDDGGVLARAINALLVTFNAENGQMNDVLSPTAVFAPEKLYRIGSIGGSRHV
jgi:hypothetical protein